MRIPRVSARFPEMTQQIHSLLARGVMSFHTASAFGVDARALRKSEGKLCTALVVTTLTIRVFYIISCVFSGVCAHFW